MRDPGRNPVQYRVGISDAMRNEVRARFENTSQHIHNVIAADFRNRPPLIDLIGKPPERVSVDDGWEEER